MSESDLLPLYPPIEPYDTQFVKVDDVHSIYVEQAGNPDGNPVLVIHGGPGGGCAPFYRQFFDPKKYRIILVDQRGAGKSTPAACLINNTTWHLIEDFEKIRKLLKIEKYLFFGGSWGSTLALAYAEKHPQVCKGLVLRGIFTLRREELLWFYQNGVSNTFPAAFEDFQAPIPAVERGDMISAYYRRLTGDDEDEKRKCALAWSIWEMRTSKLHRSADLVKRAADDIEFSLKFSRIETHYFVSGGFFESDGQLIDNAAQLNGLFPIYIVHGQYDMVCAPKNAHDLKKQLPDAKLVIVPAAGHSCTEKGIVSELVKATNECVDL